MCRAVPRLGHHGPCLSMKPQPNGIHLKANALPGDLLNKNLTSGWRFRPENCFISHQCCVSLLLTTHTWASSGLGSCQKVSRFIVTTSAWSGPKVAGEMASVVKQGSPWPPPPEWGSLCVPSCRLRTVMERAASVLIWKQTQMASRLFQG